MSAARFRLLAAAIAALSSAAGQAQAEPLVIPLPSHTITAPPAASALGSPVAGAWHDGPCLLLPPGITLFETVSDTLTFRADGTWTQTIEKATGRVQRRGTYTLTGNRLTLSSLLGTPKPALYEFSRTGDRLLLQPVGLGKSAARTLDRVRAE
jgi:hypothetical protein